MNVEKHQNEGVKDTFLKKRGRGESLISYLTPPLFGVFAWLFAGSHVMFGAYPLAFALLASLRGNPLFAWVGAVLGALSMPHDGIVYAVFYTLLLVLRLLFSAPRKKNDASEGYFRELPQLQITSAILTGTAMAAWQLMTGGLTTYTLLFSAANIALPAICTALFAGVFAAELQFEDLLGTRRYRKGQVPLAGLSPLYVEAGLITLLSAMAYSLCQYELFGLSLGNCAATLFTLSFARRRGALRGCVSGMLLALSVLPTLAPAFGILGLLSGALFSHGTGYALVLGIGGATLCASYFGGAGGLLGLLPEMGVTALLSWPLYLKMQSSDTLPVTEGESDRAVDYAAESVMSRQEGGQDGLRLLSDALLSVSDSFRREGMAEESPELADYFSLCDRVCNRFCPTCQSRSLCWEGERSCVSAIGRIAEELRHSGTLRPGSDSFFPAYCDKEGAILRGIRNEAAILCGDKHKSAHSALVATEYMMLSRLLGEESRHRREERELNAELAARLQTALAQELPQLAGCTLLVRGKRRLCLSIGTRALRPLGEHAEDIRRLMERETGLSLSMPRYEEVNRIGTLYMTAQRRFGFTAVTAVAAFRDGEVSGDVVTWFEDEQGNYTHALLSDGMGSGRRAARASQLVCGFMEQFLGAGCQTPYTVEMMHHLLRGRSEEASATVDLFSLDGISGEGAFLKCGAVSSYIKRGESLYRVRTKTPPIGILKEYGGEVVTFDMQAGDTVIIMSDGVCPEGEEASWFMQKLNEDLQSDPQKAAQQILALAAQKSGVEDDRSVMLISVYELPKGTADQDADATAA